VYKRQSITISGDTVDEVKQAMKLLTSDDEPTTEQIQFSDDSAIRMLTLGKMQEQVLTESKTFTQKDKFVTDKSGKVRVFMLRRAAAKEAHINGGTVYKQGAGYVIKLKENIDVTDVNQSIQEQETRTSTRTSGRTTSIGEERGSCGGDSGSCDCGCASGTGSTKGKISISQAKKAFKEKINEIDSGTEVGVSMSGAGENATRGGLSTGPKKKSLQEFKK
jgi:hypothetical protein